MEASMSAATKPCKHIFTHLGHAPYALVNYFEASLPSDYDNILPPGFKLYCCDHCGTPLRNVFVCRSSDGKTFNLGSVHVERLGDCGLTKAVQTKSRELRREKRQA